MSNFISLCQNTDKEEYIFLKKDSMSVLLQVMELSGCALAKTKQEKEMISFLIEKRQFMMKKENVGFDICYMPWQKNGFEVQKAFLFSVLEGVEKKIGWQTLHDKPKEAVLFFMLSRVRCLFQKITWYMIEEKRNQF